MLLTLSPSIKLIAVSFCGTLLGQNNSRDVEGRYERRSVASGRTGTPVGITFDARRLCQTWRPSSGIPAWGRCRPAPARSIRILCFPVRGEGFARPFTDREGVEPSGVHSRLSSAGGVPQMVRPSVTFPAAEHHRPLTSTELYCFVTGLYMYVYLLLHVGI